MGSGKTTLAKKLAKKLNRSFYDLDQEIEAKEHLIIPQIFVKLIWSPYKWLVNTKYLFGMPNTSVQHKNRTWTRVLLITKHYRIDADYTIYIRFIIQVKYSCSFTVNNAAVNTRNNYIAVLNI